MKIDLTGKTAVVSGSTAGIGLAIAMGLADAGAAVVVNGRTDAAVSAAVTAVQQRIPGARVTGVAADLGTADGCARLVLAAPTTDILVNNVGIFKLQDFFETPDSEWERFFDVNVMSGVRLSRAYAEKMVATGWGRIVFISSESGLNIPPDMIHYGFTKTANLAVSRGLAKRLTGTGVTVNAVLPGPTLSDGLVTAFQGAVTESGTSIEEVTKAFIKAKRPSSILQRATTVEEVANMVVYVCSTQASGTTGAALRVDGGVVDTIS